ncbi:MAG: hypothetical protein AAGJ94_13280 [Pseudomonadota bacterium]
MKPQTSAATEGMIDYDRHSHMQYQHILSRSDVISDLVAKIGRVDPEFVIADYGCGPASSALESVRPAVETYQKLHPGAPLTVRHSDQPGNDWNALSALVFGPKGYDKGTGPVRTEFAVGSFYDQMAGDNTLSLSTCFTASHWLRSAVSIHSPGTLLFADLTGDARQEVAAQADRDWDLFVRNRIAELRPGGYTMISTLGSTPDPSEINGVRSAACKLYRGLYKVAEGMAQDGLVQQDALDQFVFPLWFQTVEEAKRPFARDPGLLETVEIIEASLHPAAYHPDDLYEDHLSDPETYGALYSAYVRGFGESSLKLHLFEPSANSVAEAEDLTETFFARLAALYRDEPGVYAFESMIVTLILRKR